MLLHQHPALDYITWQGLVIIDGVNSVEDEAITQEQYIIEDGKSMKKYIYWDKSNPYVLKDSNEWVNSTSTIKLIYINDKGEGTEVPQDGMNYYYTDKSSGSGGGLLIGKMMGQFDEIDGKFYSITEDIDGIKQTLGMNGEVGSDGSIIDKLNKLEVTVEGNTNTISNVATLYNNDKETEELRDRMNVAFLDIMTALAEYEDTTTEAMKDLVINDDERTLVNEKMALLNEKLVEVNECHTLISGRIDHTENADIISQLNSDNTAMNNAINNLNSNVSNVIKSNTVPTSAITTILGFFAQASTRIKNYQETLKGVNVLGLGGVVFSNIQIVKETATEYSRTIESLNTVVNGDDGLVEIVEKHSTAIEQNAETIQLSCLKYDIATSQITLGDSVIKLDASKVLMTGTLTWDSLDEEAKSNLKGEDGTNATAEYVMLTGDQIFKYDAEGNPEILSVTLRATAYNVTSPIYAWYYKQQGSSTYVKLNNTFSIYALAHDDAIWGGYNAISIKVEVSWSGSNTTVSDEMTVVKLFDGANGQDGADGQDGTNGANAQYVKITGEQYFKYGADLTEPPTPISITLTGEAYNVTATNSHWYYKDSNGAWQEFTLYANQNILTINHTDDIFVERYATIKYTIGTVYDVFTLVKLVDGEDGVAIVLSNENHSVPCETDGSYANDALDDAYTTIRAYKGVNEVSFNLKKTDIGCTSTYDTSTKTLKITKLTEDKATVDMSIIIDGQTFKKTMTITKALRGLQGLEGNGLAVLGEFDSVDDLPSTGNPGDAYMINGLLYIWSANTNGWGDGVPIRGEQGLPGKDGVDGQTTYTHIKYSNDGKTFTSNNGEDPGTWMGMYTDFSINDSNTFGDYTWFKVVGEDGENGIVADLTNDTHIIPVNSDGTLGDNAFDGCSTTISLSYNGTTITTGVTYSYTKSDSVTGTWSSGTYTVTDLSADTGYVDMKANYNGVTYTKRFTISKNVDGITYYTWIKYADDANGSGLSDNPTGKTYIGFAYNKLTATESTTASDYTWSLIKGDKGDTGETGATGKDGTTYYTWIKYSPNQDGSEMTDEPYDYTQPITFSGSITSSPSTGWNALQIRANYLTGVLYINNIVVTLSGGATNYASTTSLEIYGQNIDNQCTTINLTDYTALRGQSFTITFNYYLIGHTNAPDFYIQTEGSTDNGETAIWTRVGDIVYVNKNTEYIGIATNKTTATESTIASDYKWSKFKGDQGVDGSNGEDAYVINLSNDNHSFVADSSGNITTATSTTINVTAYKGNEKLTPTIGTITAPSGMSVSTSETTITVTANTGTSLATTGTFTIPVIVDDITFNKEFSWAKVNIGANGSDGYTILLTNETETFTCENDGNITSTITKTTKVLAYRGTTSVTPTIGTLPTVSGLTLSKSGITITIVANTGTSLASSGSFDIPITVDGILFTKTFSWTKSFKGADGSNGSDATVPSWVTEWDSNKTTINGTTVLSPKMFAGTVSNGVPTGVAMGDNVFGTSGTYSNISGIAGYRSGTKTYHLSTDGNFLVGTSSGNHVSWDGTTLDIRANAITTYAGNSLDSVASTASSAQSTASNASSTASNAYSLATQSNDKVGWIVSGSSSTSFTLTSRMASLISDKISLEAKTIELTGSININNGTFTVDTSGNFTANKGSMRGVEITSESGSDWTYINGGYIECGGTTSRYWLGSSEGNQTTKLKSENGRFRARNDTYNRSVYFSDQGLSTTADGEIGSSGIIDFHNDWYGYGDKGLAMFSNHHVSMIAYNGYCNISPEWANTGNNTFSFQVFNAESGGASDTDGLIYYGSHKNGYSTCLRISKDASDPYLQVLNGSLGSDAKLMAEYVKTTMVNNNYFTNGTLTMNQTYQGTQGGTQTYLSGTAVSATKFYQNGSTVSTSDIILKDNIQEYTDNALEIIDKTNIYTFNRINDPDNMEIGFIAQEMPDEFIYQKGKFTAEELKDLTAEEKTTLLNEALAERIEETKINCYNELSNELTSFYDLDEEDSQYQIDLIQDTINNLEYVSPVYMLNKDNIIAIMFKAIKELKTEIDKLKNN